MYSCTYFLCLFPYLSTDPKEIFMLAHSCSFSENKNKGVKKIHLNLALSNCRGVIKSVICVIRVDEDLPHLFARVFYEKASPFAQVES